MEFTFIQSHKPHLHKRITSKSGRRRATITGKRLSILKARIDGSICGG
jgi:hypothetical protein